MNNDFDVAAKTYDTDFTFSKIGLAQRQIVYSNLNTIFKAKTKLNILELNCGTGYDALNFAKAGHNVIASDISEDMITIAKSKKRPKNISFITQDINTITQSTFNKKFDLILSNFGGLNCLSKSELNSLIEKSVDLLNPNGKLILVIMPKNTLWERLYFSLKGDFIKAKRRNTNISLNANVDGISVKTWYYNPKDIISLTNTYFKKDKIKPIGLTIPTSYLENSILAKRPLLSIFKNIDSVITGEFWAKYADHFYIEMSKKPSTKNQNKA